MSRCLAELCFLLIEDLLGGFYAHIFSVLLSHGRLVAYQIARRSRLSPRQAQYGLAVLAQAGLLYHHTTDEGRTFYQASARNAYYLIRSGRLIDTVDKKYGKAAAAMAVQLLLLGHASVGQLKRSAQRHEGSVRTAGDTLHDDEAKSMTFHYARADNHSAIELNNALKTLISQGLVCRLRQAHLQTEADNCEIAEKQMHNMPALSTAKGTKAKEEIAAKIKEITAKQADSCIHVDLVNSSSNSTSSTKRKINPLDGSTPNSKRPKVVNAGTVQEVESELASMVEDETASYNDGLVVRINHRRLAVLFRSSRLLTLVANTHGRNVSRTYEAVLEQLQLDQPDPTVASSVAPQNEHPGNTSKEVDESRLAQDLFHRRTNEGRPGSHWNSVNGYVGRHHLPPEVCSHLEILCEEPFRFLSHSHEHPDKYVVEYSDLCIQLRNAEVFQIISARFDKYALRVVRVLLDRGKVDERWLQEIVLMSAKELRQTLAILYQAGFLELQEVPRESQRQPSRTMYLWFYDPDRVRKMLIEDTYKCMSRCMQRMKVERDKVKPTIEKSERSDVRDRQERILSKAELGVLKEWRRKEAWLLGELGRLDGLVFALRDF